MIGPKPDVKGLLGALRRLPDRTPEQRRVLATAAAAHGVADAMAAGRRYSARSLPRARRPRTSLPDRCPRGHFLAPLSSCGLCDEQRGGTCG